MTRKRNPSPVLARIHAALEAHRPLVEVVAASGRTVAQQPTAKTVRALIRQLARWGRTDLALAVERLAQQEVTR